MCNISCDLGGRSCHMEMEGHGNKEVIMSTYCIIRNDYDYLVPLVVYKTSCNVHSLPNLSS